MNVVHRPEELEPARRAVAVGTFDGVHRGHARVLEAATASGLRPAVVTFDPHPRTLFGEPVELLTSLERRIELFAALGIEDVLVCRFDPGLAELPLAFRCNVVCVVSDGFAMQYGTAFTPFEHFAPWNVDDDGVPVKQPAAHLVNQPVMLLD